MSFPALFFNKFDPDICHQIQAEALELFYWNVCINHNLTDPKLTLIKCSVSSPDID